MPVVPSELGVGALERRITVSFRLLDTASRCQLSCPNIQSCTHRGQATEGIKRLLELVRCRRRGNMRTRSCGSSSTGCAETSSLTLYRELAARTERWHYIADLLAMATDLRWNRPGVVFEEAAGRRSRKGCGQERQTKSG